MRQSWRLSAKKYCLFCTKSLRSCGVLIKDSAEVTFQPPLEFKERG